MAGPGPGLPEGAQERRGGEGKAAKIAAEDAAQASGQRPHQIRAQAEGRRVRPQLGRIVEGAARRGPSRQLGHE